MKNTTEEKTAEITTYTDRPDKFWAAMGPFFARREVRREMPYLVDEDGDVWFVARIKKQVVGFVAVSATKKGASNIHALYVAPQYRGNGIAESLIESALSYLREQGTQSATTTANAKSVPLFEAQGFSEVTAKGQYIVMELAPLNIV